MEKGLKIIGVIVCVILAFFGGWMLNKYLYDRSFEDHPIDLGEILFFIGNEDLTLVEKDDKIEAKNYCIFVLNYGSLIKLKDNKQIESDTTPIVPDSNYDNNTFGLVDAGSGKVMGTFNFKQGQTWGQWCESDFSIYEGQKAFSLMLDCVRLGFVD